MNTNLKKALLGVTAISLIASGALSSPANAASPLTVTVSKTTNLAYSGESVNITVAGIPSGQGVYVFQCATDALAPRPWARSGDPANKCGSINDGLWLSSPAVNTPASGVITTEASALNPMMLKRLLVVDGTTYDCATTACSVFVMRDRRNGGTADTALDSITPISFFATETSQRIGFTSGAKSLSKANKKKIKSDLASYQAASQIVITATAGSTVGASDKVVKNLAKKRANAIKKYLVAQGIPAEKIVIKARIAKPGKKPSTKVVATP
jgi:hypothetical protein